LNLVTVLALHTAKSEDEIIKTAMKITKVSGRISEEQSLRRTGDGNLDDWEFNSLEEHLEKLSIEAQSIFQNKNKDDPEKINTWYAFSKLIDCFSYSEYWDQIPKLMDAIKSNRGINEVFRKKEG
ncbi:hypothetical protein, partial [Mesorhizobium sp. M7A.F.Ca.CA.002.10.1.1]